MSPLPSRFAPMLAAPAGTLAGAARRMDDRAEVGRQCASSPKSSARSARLWTRNGNDKAPQFPEIADALTKLAREHGPFVLDGEIVALDAKGRALRFQALQGRVHAERDETRARRRRRRAALVAFDLLVVDGAHAHRAAVDASDARHSRRSSRRGRARSCGAASRCAAAARRRRSCSTARARKAGRACCSSASTRRTRAGRRTPDWRKVKLEREQEFVIGGFTAPTQGAARDHLGALLVGYYDDARPPALRRQGRHGLHGVDARAARAQARAAAPRDVAVRRRAAHRRRRRRRG